MNKIEVLKLKPGDKVRWKHNGQVVTVVDVLLHPTTAEPRGKFPLVITKEKGAITYLALRHEHKPGS